MEDSVYSPYPNNPVRNWDDLVEVEDKLGEGEWAFRGQDRSDFPSTSLERHCRALNVDGDKVAELEIQLVRDFARSYHLYDGLAGPSPGRTLQWMALLQHYGGPTRLLDFTYSFFTAAYFAIENIQATEKCPVVWAVRVSNIKKQTQELIQQGLSNASPNGTQRVADYHRDRDGEAFQKLFIEPRLQFVYPTNPILLNDRLQIQQGMFLAPGDVTTTFEENVRAVPNHDEHVLQITIEPGCRKAVLRKLHRLGINRATLFPGLEGFAHSLRTKSLILKDLDGPDIQTMLKQF